MGVLVGKLFLKRIMYFLLLHLKTRTKGLLWVFLEELGERKMGVVPGL